MCVCTHTHICILNTDRDTAWHVAWAVWVLALSLKGVTRAWELMGTNRLGDSTVHFSDVGHRC